MAQSPTQPPGTGSNMPDIGNSFSWINPSFILTDNSRYATVDTGVNPTIKDLNVRLVNSSGVMEGDDKADTSTAWDTTDTYKDYGGDTDTWGLTLTQAIVSDTDFGVAIRIQDALGQYSNPLYASNYGFAISSAVTITGVKVSIKRFNDFNSGTGVSIASINYIPMTIYYRLFIPKTTWFIPAMITGLVTNIVSTAGGFWVCMEQTSYPSNLKFI